MAKQAKSFTAGVITGSAATLGALAGFNLLARLRHNRIVRLEKSLQIGRPVDEVFRAWVDLERLPQLSPAIQQITRHGDRSHWRVVIDGQTYEWDAMIEQFIPNQSVGWKSLSGPKHTGRISFSPIGHDTLVHVTMNYAPPMRLFSPFFPALSEHLENRIERVLRDFKASIEKNAQPAPVPHEPVPATGTFGGGQDMSGRTQHIRFGGAPSPADWPSESKT
jgi:uncharacterized membrane protein